jgi:hypothetical protein
MFELRRHRAQCNKVSGTVHQCGSRGHGAKRCDDVKRMTSEQAKAKQAKARQLEEEANAAYPDTFEKKHGYPVYDICNMPRVLEDSVAQHEHDPGVYMTMSRPFKNHLSGETMFAVAVCEVYFFYQQLGVRVALLAVS